MTIHYPTVAEDAYRRYPFFRTTASEQTTLFNRSKSGAGALARDAGYEASPQRRSRPDGEAHRIQLKFCRLLSATICEAWLLRNSMFEKPARSATTAAADFIGETGTVPEPQAVACPSCGAQLMFRRSPQPFIDSCGFESSASHAENAQLRWPASSIGATTRCCFPNLRRTSASHRAPTDVISRRAPFAQASTRSSGRGACSKRPRSCAAEKSSSGPSGTMRVGLIAVILM